jgi:NTE family protein
VTPAKPPRPRARKSAAARPKTFALALGGGGARSLAEIVVLEAVDEMGVKPVAIAGTSLGALIGAAYAAGMSGTAIRRHVLARMHERGLFARLVRARAGSISEWVSAPFGNPMLIDPTRFCAAFLPPGLAEDFAALDLPLTLVAADFYGRREAAFSTGALKPAIAASMALPGLVRPMEIAGRVLVDGAAVNPIPFDCLRGKADLIVAVDCSGGPPVAHGIPGPWETLFGTVQVVAQAIVAEKLKGGAPDLMITPRLPGFRLFDFLRASAILRAAAPVKEEVKRKLGALLN